MNATLTLQAALIASCFAGWPIVARFSGVGGGWSVSLISAGTLLAAGALATRSMVGADSPGWLAFSILLVSGLLNGAAVYGFGARATDPAVPAAAFVATTYVLMVIATPLIESSITHTLPTFRQVAGFALAGAGVWLIANK